MWAISEGHDPSKNKTCLLGENEGTILQLLD